MNLVTPKAGAEHELLFKNWIILVKYFVTFSASLHLSNSTKILEFQKKNFSIPFEKIAPTTATRDQCYKTFSVRNLRAFVIS
jgi:hypothetical protein